MSKFDKIFIFARMGPGVIAWHKVLWCSYGLLKFCVNWIGTFGFDCGLSSWGLMLNVVYLHITGSWTGYVSQSAKISKRMIYPYSYSSVIYTYTIALSDRRNKSAGLSRYNCAYIYLPLEVTCARLMTACYDHELELMLTVRKYLLVDI